VRLLLGGHQRQRVELGQRRRTGAIERPPHIVLGRAMLDDGRPARQHIRVALQNIVGVLAFEPVEQRGEAMHVVEILQQPEAIGLREIRIGLLLCERGCHLDRDLLVGDRRLDRRMICAEQPIDHRRLVMLNTPDLRQRQSQRQIHACGRVLKAQRLHLQAVHEDDAHASECVVVEFADRLARELAPGEALPVERRAAIFEKCQCHG